MFKIIHKPRLLEYVPVLIHEFFTFTCIFFFFFFNLSTRSTSKQFNPLPFFYIISLYLSLFLPPPPPPPFSSLCRSYITDIKKQTNIYSLTLSFILILFKVLKNFNIFSDFFFYCCSIFNTQNRMTVNLFI